MPDIGVLELQIHDDSEQSAQGLDKIADALFRVKRAVKDGLKLSGVARQLSRIAQVVNTEINDSTISKLKDFGDAMARLKGLGDVKVNIKVTDSIRNAASIVDEAKTSFDSINTGFDEFGQRAYQASESVDAFGASMRNMNDLMSNTNWSDGLFQFRQMLEAMSRMRASVTLGPGEQVGVSTEVEKGWEEWKNGAIEVEGTVSDAMDTINARLGEPIQYLTGIDSQLGSMDDYLENGVSLTEELARTTSAMSDGKNALAVYTGGVSELDDALEEVRESAEETTASFAELRQEAGATMDDIDYSMNDWGKTPPKRVDVDSEKEAIEYVNRLIDGASQIDLLNMKIEALRDKLVDGVNTGKMTADQIANTVGQIRNLQEEVEKLNTSTSAVGRVMGNLKNGIEKLGLSKLISRFVKTARNRMIRYAIREISSGFSEGVENVYNYSKAIKGSFASSMDSAASSLQTMKNSLGAAAAPLIQSLIPLLQTLVNWFITAVNWLNQFFALLNGQKTWTKALPATATAFDKQAKSAKKAGAAIKDLLADWDELNIIQSNTTGGVGGGSAQAAEDYLKMFEEVGTFDNDVRKVFDFVKDNLGTILALAGGIWGVIQAWGLSTAFADALPTLSKIFSGAAALGSIVITLALTDITGQAFAKTGEPGWFIADALTGAVGATMAWGFAKKIAGGAAASITSGITLTLAAAVNVKNALGAAAQKQVARWGMLTALAGVESGIGAALIAKGLALSTATSFGLGGIAAIATIAISVGAMIKMSQDSIEWGEVTLTDEDVRTFVEQRMFKGIDVTATVDLVAATIESVSVSRKELEDQIAGMLPTINSIKLGVDKQKSYQELQKQIFGDEVSGTKGLISKIQTYAEKNVQELKTTFALIPVIDESGKDVSAELLKEGITGWNEVDAYVNQLGVDLGKELSKGFTEDGLAKFDEDAVRAITDKMVKISQIITGSQIESAAQADLSMGLNELGLSDLNQDSVDKVVSLFNDYKTKLEEEYTKIYTDSANQYLVLARFYKETGNTELAEFYTDEYNKLIKMMPTSVAQAVNNAAAPGLEMVYDFLREKFSDVFTRIALNLNDGGSGAFRQTLLANFTPTEGDIQKSAKDLNAALAKIFGGENMFLQRILTEMPGVSLWNAMTEQMQDNLKIALEGLYGPEIADAIVNTYVPQIQEAADTIENSIPDIETPAPTTDTTMGEATEVVQAAGQELEELTNTANETQKAVNGINIDIDDTKITNSTNNAATAFEDMAKRIRDAFASLDGLSYEMDVQGEKFKGAMSVLIPVQAKAMGGPVRSGDLVMADENGKFEMMGRMGNQPVVANNQQIVNGITQGVATANGNVVSELSTLSNLMRQLLQKELVAKVVPSSSMGRSNQMSAEAYSRVTG